MESNTIKVDKYRVGTTNDFQITTKYVIDMFNEFNYRYFDGKLYLDSSVKVKVYPYKNVLGSVAAVGTFNKITGYCSATITEFHISNYFNRSEFTYCNTILHEMIHIYQYQVLKLCDGHGVSFIKKMDEINKFGWDISITETTEERKSRGNKNQSVLDKEARQKQQKEQESDTNNYVLLVWIPIGAESIKGDRKIAFHIIEKDLPKKCYDVIKYCINLYNSNNLRDYYIFTMENSSHIAQLLKSYGYFEKRYRISKDFLVKKLSSGVYTTENIATPILRRTYALPYNMFKTDEEKGLIKSMDNKELPPMEFAVRESVNLNKKINSAEDFVDTMEKDPYINILSAEDLGGVIKFKSVIS